MHYGGEYCNIAVVRSLTDMSILTDMLTMTRGRTLFILEGIDQWSLGQGHNWFNNLVNTIEIKPLNVFWSNVEQLLHIMSG